MIDDIKRQALIELLTELTTSNNKFGFHPAKVNRKFNYIFVKAQEKPADSQGVWYRLIEENGVGVEKYLDPVKEYRFEGNLVEVSLVKVQTKYGEQLKIDLIFDVGDDLHTVIRSGASTFSEGVLRSLMCVELISNPLNVIPQRADKSEKAVFSTVEMNGKRLMLQKDMPRLITWNPKIKPTIEQVASTFLPAVNMVREKLGLDPLDAPVDREAEYQSSLNPTDSNPVVPTIVTDRDITAAITQLQWNRKQITDCLMKNFSCERISLLSVEQRSKFTEMLELSIKAQATNSQN